MGTSAGRKFTHADYTVGWICALPLELAASTAMLDDHHDSLPNPAGDNNTYTLGNIGPHNIVAACLPAGVYGTTSAATVASQMRRSFPSIKFGLMVGIGGGVPSNEHDIRLGDVVVSKPTGKNSGVLQYDFGKTVAEGKFEPTGSWNKPPFETLTALAKVEANHERGCSRVAHYVSTMLQQEPEMKSYTHPGAEQDVLFQATYEHRGQGRTCASCDPKRRIKRPLRQSNNPVIHYGVIASGNQVMKHATTRDQLSKQLDGILCFEMEAAGLVESLPCLVIRGICDYSDSHKNKNWQKYAAATAAAYAKEFLNVVERKDKYSSSPSEGTTATRPGELTFIPVNKILTNGTQGDRARKRRKRGKANASKRREQKQSEQPSNEEGGKRLPHLPRLHHRAPSPAPPTDPSPKGSDIQRAGTNSKTQSKRHMDQPMTGDKPVSNQLAEQAREKPNPDTSHWEDDDPPLRWPGNQPVTAKNVFPQLDPLPEFQPIDLGFHLNETNFQKNFPPNPPYCLTPLFDIRSHSQPYFQLPLVWGFIHAIDLPTKPITKFPDVLSEEAYVEAIPEPEKVIVSESPTAQHNHNTHSLPGEKEIQVVITEVTEPYPTPSINSQIEDPFQLDDESDIETLNEGEAGILLEAGFDKLSLRSSERSLREKLNEPTANIVQLLLRGEAELDPVMKDKLDRVLRPETDMDHDSVIDALKQLGSECDSGGKLQKALPLPASPTQAHVSQPLPETRRIIPPVNEKEPRPRALIKQEQKLPLRQRHRLLTSKS